MSTERTQFHTHTCFYRHPYQLDALITKVVPFIGKGTIPRSLLINITACSNGAEAYTVASELIAKFPSLDFKIIASDLHEHTIEQARAAIYQPNEVFAYSYTPREFIDRTFDRCGDNFIVKPAIREKVSFSRANLLDSSISDQYPPADIVFAQHVLCHLNASEVAIAFQNLQALLKQRSALFISGMDLDLKSQLTLQAQLNPLEFKTRDIHEHARKYHTPLRWWSRYYGVEPYLYFRSDKQRRYGTIFLRELK